MTAPMHLTHDPALLDDFPQLVVTTHLLTDVTPDVDVSATAAPFLQRAADRLTQQPESELPEITAWRRAFSQMGLKPTQYRCASEALLRRFRKDGHLPSIHPVVDLCNAISLAHATPIAVFDLTHVTGNLTVTRADGTENYLSFSGEIENPEPGEVIYRDDAGNAHSRRWTNRQSALSAIRPDTHTVLISCEALHDTAREDCAQLRDELTEALDRHWPTP